MKRSEKVEELIRKHMVYSTALGLIPLPVVDVVSVTASQVKMVQTMCDYYDVDYDEGSTKAILTALTGSTLARLGASMVKAIPVVGLFIGSVSMAVLSGASTYAVGKVFQKHFDNEGDLKNFDVNVWKKFYEDQFEAGKKEAEKVEKNKDSYEDVFSRLEKLAKLKDKGIITQAEYQAKKDELMKDI
jgi:uncharacterized protein (DUF697 family)